MKARYCLVTLAVISTIFWICQSSLHAAPFQSAQNDTSESAESEFDTTIVYTNVDVVVQTEWGDPERNENVQAEVSYKDEVARQVVLKGKQYKKCEIFLKGGIVVKIYDRPGGKLLKTLKAPK